MRTVENSTKEESKWCGIHNYPGVSKGDRIQLSLSSGFRQALQKQIDPYNTALVGCRIRTLTLMLDTQFIEHSRPNIHFSSWQQILADIPTAKKVQLNRKKPFPLLYYLKFLA